MNAFYTREDIMSFQDGIQSGGSLTFDPGRGLDVLGGQQGRQLRRRGPVVVRPRRLDPQPVLPLPEGRRLQRLHRRRGPGHPGEHRRLRRHHAQLLRRQPEVADFTDAWALGVGAFWEKYELADAQTQELLNYMPGSFFLVADNWGYDSWSGWLNVTYRFQ